MDGDIGEAILEEDVEKEGGFERGEDEAEWMAHVSATHPDHGFRKDWHGHPNFSEYMLGWMVDDAFGSLVDP